MSKISMLCVCALAIHGSSVAFAADWPQFRGPMANGVSAEQGAPAEWDVAKNIRWRAEAGGRGWSAPVVYGGKVIITTAIADPAAGDGGQRFEVHCYDLASGDLRWKQVAKTGKSSVPTHEDNTYATETPVTDGERIIAYFGMNGLSCYDFTGKLLWQKDLGAYSMDNDWGTASSPTMLDGLVFVQVDNEQESFLAALDAKTGDERWRVPREERSNWSSPILWKNKVRTELVTSGSAVRSYDPATGELLWEFKGISGRSSSSPAGNDELLIVGAENRSDRGGGAGGLCAIKAGATGDITPAVEGELGAHIAWLNPSAAPEMASPLIVDGLVYIFTRRGGVVRTYDLATGEQVYEKRLPGAQEVWASPWSYDGKVFALDSTGATHVLAPGRTFELIRSNPLDDGRYWASTAVADGALLIRSETGSVYCVAE